MATCHHHFMRQRPAVAKLGYNNISVWNSRLPAIHPVRFSTFNRTPSMKSLVVEGSPTTRLLCQQRQRAIAFQQTSFALRNFSYSLARYIPQQTTQNTPTTTEQQAVTDKATGGRISQFIKNSKELVRFYKDGLKQIWSNHKSARVIQETLEKEGMESLTRQEFQLLRQSKKDMIKLIPFGLIFLILPESIPLFVIFAPGMIPSTCLKDNQVRKQRVKLDEKRQEITKYTLMSSQKIEAIKPEDFLSKTKFQKLAIKYGHEFDLNYIMRKNLSAYCRFMGLSDLGTTSMLRNRLVKHMNYLDQDDKFLIKENSVDSLDMKQLSQAVEERGMRSIDDNVEYMRRALKYWLAVSQPANPQQPKIPPGLLVFSRVFLLNAKYD